MKHSFDRLHRLVPLALASALTFGMSTAHAATPVAANGHQLESATTTANNDDRMGWGCSWATEPLPEQAQQLDTTTNWWWCWP